MATLPTIDALEFAHEFPASRAQQAMLERGSISARARVLQFAGPVDHCALVRSMELLSQRHEALRTLLRKQDSAEESGSGSGSWRQIVLEQPLSVLELVDERNTPPTVQQASLQATLDRELGRLHNALQATEPHPLFRAVLITQSELRHVCVLAASAAVLDSFSFEILLEDLRHLYAVETGEAGRPLDEPGLQYADWALWEASTVQQRASPIPVGTEASSGPGKEESVPGVYIERSLSPELEERLLTLRGQESLAIPLMAALVLYCRRSSLATPVLLTSGRCLDELKQAVGPLQYCLPMAPFVGDDATSAEAVASGIRAALGSLSDVAQVPQVPAAPTTQGSALAVAEPLVLTQQFAPGIRVSWRELATHAPSLTEAGSTLTVRLLITEGRLGLGFWSRTLAPPQLDQAANTYLGLLQEHCVGDLSPMEKLPAHAAPFEADSLARTTGEPSHQAPQGEVECKLAEIWSAVLQVSEIGRDENFFDLGGHSLLAVRIGTRIERAFGKEVPLNAILELPTIAEFATLLAPRAEQESAGDAAEDQGAPEGQHRLVTLQEPGAGISARTPFFWIPGGRAVSVLALREVSLLLGPDRPVYGVESRLPQAGESFLSVPDRARLYLDVIRHKQPQGPYLLAGFCVGGMVAFEMAQQLQQQGEQVAFLGLLQASMPGFPGSPSQRRLMERQRKLYLGRTMLDFLLLRLSPIHRRRSREQRQEVLDRFAKLLTGWVGTSSRLPELTQETNGVAMQAYRPQPYEGAVHIFLAQDCFESSGIAPALDPRRAWASMARSGAATTVVPGDHVSMLTQAPARSLAEAIRSALPL